MQSFSDDYVLVVKNLQLPKLLNGLRNKEWDHLYDEEIRDKCYSIFPTICVTNEIVINCEKLTKEQSKAKLWFNLRACRITASNIKAVCRTDASNPSKSLIKKICYAQDKFSNNATKMGNAEWNHFQMVWFSDVMHWNVDRISGLCCNTNYSRFCSNQNGWM